MLIKLRKGRKFIAGLRWGSKATFSALYLTGVGVGSCLGTGVYILPADVSKNHAGPAVVVSFLLAAIASSFAGKLLYCFFFLYFYVHFGL